MRIAIASDHAAVELRQAVIEHLVEKGHAIEDLGVVAGEKADYPSYAAAVAAAVMHGGCDRGILLCGSGIGMSISANKIDGIRAALVHDTTTARLAAAHNDANILCLGARTTGPLVAVDCVDAWLDTPFESRHQRRLDLIRALEG